MATILIVDDQAVNRRALRGVFEAEGFTVLEADDGPAGLEAFRVGAPDLVVADLLMPKMDGFEFAYRLRGDQGPGARVPVLLVSAWAMPPEVEPLAHACGVDRILGREDNPDEVLHAVRDALVSPREVGPVRPWPELAMDLLRFHSGKLAQKVRTVLPALAALVDFSAHDGPSAVGP